MASLTPTLTLTTSSLTSSDLSFSVSTSPTVTDTTGLRRTTLTSVSKVTKLTVLDGNDNTAPLDNVTLLEGQYVEITDNHGLKIKYVFADSAASGVANDGTVIVAATDLGSQAASAVGAHLYGGRVVQIADNDTQRAVLQKLVVVINSSGGHNGSITAAAVASVADGPQSTTMTNAVVGESGVFSIDAANATWVHIDNTKDADATNSGSDHAILVDKNEFLSPAFVYIKNTANFSATAGRVFCYYDNHGAEDIMEIRGGHFAFVPLSPNNNLKAYTSTSGTIVEYMVIGDDA